MEGFIAAGDIVQCRELPHQQFDIAKVIEFSGSDYVLIEWASSNKRKLILNDPNLFYLSSKRSRNSASSLINDRQSITKRLKRNSIATEDSTNDSDEDSFYNSNSSSLTISDHKQSKEVSIKETAEAKEITLQSLSKFQKSFENFVSSKVMKLLASHDDHPTNISDNVIEEQPKNISKTFQLRSYQLEGLSWLIRQYDSCINSILADEMGLGKTLQTISFISYLAQTRKCKGLHLVVAPLSVMFNWIAEFKKFCPSLKVQRLHSHDVDEQNRLKEFIKKSKQLNVIVTTYDTVKTGGFSNLLHSITWRTIILDEGHRIKNESSQVSHSCTSLKGRFKLILTGTPVQNNLSESYALLHFLHPDIFTEAKSFAENFISEGPQMNRNLLDKTHYLMRPFILRRLKSEVEGKLPPKLETKISCPMTDMQKYWVKMLLYKDRELVSRFTSGDSCASHSSNRGIMSLLANLRKAANHPYLFPNVELPTLDGRPDEEIITCSGKMIVLNKLLDKLLIKGHRIVLFSQFTRTLDILSDYLDMKNIRCYRIDGSTNRVMRDVLINSFNKPNSKINIFLLSTRAGGEGVNLFTADTVILFDSDWNPQVDIQAMARVHRIGQKNIVHIYRLVSSGSVEERIVQRAQQKLFLDSMINRGSTSHALAIDEEADSDVELEGNATLDDEDEVKENNVSKSNLLSTLKFGWNSLFSITSNNSSDNFISDEEIDLIIDRNRGLSEMNLEDRDAANPSSSDQEINSKNQLVENQQYSIDSFDETMPLIPISEDINKELSSEFNKDITIKDISEFWRRRSQNRYGIEGPQLESVDNSNATVEDNNDLLTDPISSTQMKRQSIKRLSKVFVPGVGFVETLIDKSKTNPDKRSDKQQNVSFVVKKSNRQVAGRDYSHFDTCQVCWDGGELYLCDLCPCVFHNECLPKHSKPNGKGMTWSCTHHYCCVCNRRSGAVGLLFRCEICYLAYCEDCLPSNAVTIGVSNRFENVGYRLTNSACYIQCSMSCIKFAIKDAPSILGASYVNSNDDRDQKLETESSEMKSDNDGEENDSDDNDADDNDALNTAKRIQDMQRSAAHHAIELSALPNLQLRLQRYKTASTAKFHSLNEIPNLRIRLEKATGSVIALLSRIMKSLAEMFKIPMPDNVDERLINSGNRAMLIEWILQYTGAPIEAADDDISDAFLSVARTLGSCSKRDIINTCHTLGLLEISVFRMKQAVEDDSIPPEPCFRNVSETFNRRNVEDAIAAFLVIPHLQNLFFSARDISSDSLFYCARGLETLGEYLSDGNLRIVPYSLKFEPLFKSKVSSWQSCFPAGRNADRITLQKWLAPAMRLMKCIGIQAKLPIRLLNVLKMNPNVTLSQQSLVMSEQNNSGFENFDANFSPSSGDDDDDDNYSASQDDEEDNDNVENRFPQTIASIQQQKRHQQDKDQNTLRITKFGKISSFPSMLINGFDVTRNIKYSERIQILKKYVNVYSGDTVILDNWRATAINSEHRNVIRDLVYDYIYSFLNWKDIAESLAFLIDYDLFFHSTSLEVYIDKASLNEKIKVLLMRSYLLNIYRAIQSIEHYPNFGLMIPNFPAQLIVKTIFQHECILPTKDDVVPSSSFNDIVLVEPGIPTQESTKPIANPSIDATEQLNLKEPSLVTETEIIKKTSTKVRRPFELIKYDINFIHDGQLEINNIGKIVHFPSFLIQGFDITKNLTISEKILILKKYINIYPKDFPIDSSDWRNSSVVNSQIRGMILAIVREYLRFTLNWKDVANTLADQIELDLFAHNESFEAYINKSSVYEKVKILLMRSYLMNVYVAVQSLNNDPNFGLLVQNLPASMLLQVIFPEKETKEEIEVNKSSHTSLEVIDLTEDTESIVIEPSNSDVHEEEIEVSPETQLAGSSSPIGPSLDVTKEQNDVLPEPQSAGSSSPIRPSLDVNKEQNDVLPEPQSAGSSSSIRPSSAIQEKRSRLLPEPPSSKSSSSIRPSSAIQEKRSRLFPEPPSLRSSNSTLFTEATSWNNNEAVKSNSITEDNVAKAEIFHDLEKIVEYSESRKSLLKSLLHKFYQYLVYKKQPFNVKTLPAIIMEAMVNCEEEHYDRYGETESYHDDKITNRLVYDLYLKFYPLETDDSVVASPALDKYELLRKHVSNIVESFLSSNIEDFANCLELELEDNEFKRLMQFRTPALSKMTKSTIMKVMSDSINSMVEKQSNFPIRIPDYVEDEVGQEVFSSTNSVDEKTPSKSIVKIKRPVNAPK